MNPFDAIGTARVSHAIADRICRVVLGYRDEAAERHITTGITGHRGPVVDFAVALTRATREHPDARLGSSVRGAIDLVLLLTGLIQLRAEPRMTRASARDAAHAALSGRIRIADGCERTPESVLDELLDQLWPAGSPDPLPLRTAEHPTGPARVPWTAREKVTACRQPRQAPATTSPAMTSPAMTSPARTGPARARPPRPRPAATGAGARPGGASAGPSWPPGTRRSLTSRRGWGSSTRTRSPGCWPTIRTQP